MRTTYKLSVVLYAGLCLGGIVRGSVDPIHATYRAIVEIESRGDCNAVGDDGRAIGPAQIHREYWADACRFMRVDWPYSDARNPEKAFCAVWAYTWVYCQRQGLQWTHENIARTHVGGPRGPYRKSSLPYWYKVKSEMEKTK